MRGFEFPYLEVGTLMAILLAATQVGWPRTRSRSSGSNSLAASLKIGRMNTNKEQSERFFQGTPIQALNGKLTKVNKDILLDGGLMASHLENVPCTMLGVRRNLSILKVFGRQGFGLVVSFSDHCGELVEQAYFLALPSLARTVDCLTFSEVEKLLSASLQTLSWVDRYLQKWPLGLKLFSLILEVLPFGYSKNDCSRCFLEFIDEQSSKEIVKKMDVPHQGPISSRMKSRLSRELVQREKAAAKMKAAKQEVPKQLRKSNIYRARAQKEFQNSFINEEGLGGFVKDVAFLPYNIAKGASALARAAIRISEAIDGTINDPVLLATAGSVAGSAVHIAHTANERSQHIAASIDRVAEHTTGVATKIREVIEQIQTFLTKDLPYLAVQVLLGGFLAYLFHKFKAPVARMAIVSVAGVLFARDVYNLFSAAFLKGDESFIAEESGFPSFFTQAVSMVFMTSLFAAERPPTWTALFGKVTSVIGNLPRLEKGIESLVQFLMDAIEKGVNAVREYIGKHPVRLFRKFATGVEEKLDESNIFVFDIISGKLKDRMWSDAAIYNKFLTYIEYFTLVRRETTAGSTIRAEVDRHIAKLMRLAEPFKVSMNSAGGFRPQPVTVVLGGKPGIGKTTVTQSFCLTVMKLCGHLSENADVTEASRSIFMKPANSKYMDGYTNQFAFLIDDLFQIKPVPGVEGGEIEDIMTHHGPISASLNMADLPKKGMYPFVSRLMLCTTNATNLESQVGVSGIILSVEALERRFEHHVLMQVKPQYRLPGSHMLDYQKFKQEEERAPDSMHAYPWHIWEVQDAKFDGSSEFEPGTGRCMIDFIDEIVAHIKYNELSHESSQVTFEKIIKAPVATWSERPVREESTSCDWGECHEIHPIEEEEEFLENTVVLDNCDELAMLTALTEDYVKYSRKGSPEDVMDPQAIMFLIKETDAGATNRIKKYFYDTYAKFSWEKTVKVLKYCSVAAVAVTAVVFLVRAGYESLHHFFFGKPVSEESNGPKVRTAHCFKQEMIVTQNGNADVPGLWYNVYKNTYKVLLEQSDKDYKVLGQLLIVEGTTFVMPYHFIKDMEKSKAMGFMTDNDYIVFRSCAIQRHDIRVKMGDFLRFKWHIEADRDLAFSTFGNAIARKRSIVHFLMRESTISDQGGKAVRLDTARVTARGELLEFSERVSYFSQGIEVSNGRSKYIGTYPNGTDHKRWIRYHAETLPGDCGAVLSVTDHASTACQFVIGLHVGRREGSDEAYATQLDQEVVRRALEIFGSRVVPEVPFEEINNQSDYKDLGIEVQPISELPFTEGDTGTFGSFVPVCEVSKGVVSPIDSSKVITVLGREQFFKEQIKDLSGANEVPELEVMKLKSFKDVNGDIIFPMAEALRPFAGNTLYVPEKKFERAVFVAMKPFSDATLQFPSRVLTFEEAVVGVPSMEFSSIPRATSLGYPWCTAARNKSYFFGKSEEYDLNTLEALKLKEQVLALEDTIRGGRRPLFLCRDFLKDEVRKKGKGARLIAGTDVRYYILCRMYFGAFVSALIRSHQKSGACLGVNQYSEWPWLEEFITRKGDKVWDGDFAGFDSSQQPQMLWAILHFINSWYDLHGDGDSNDMRKILFMDLVHSRHLVSLRGKATKVVEWVKSLPSGHFLTSTVNTILSMSCLVGAYIGLTGRVDFWDHAGVAAQGDDNLVNADESVIAEYNQVTCAQFLRSEYGLIYTAGRKGEELKPYMGIEDVIFLQRTFRKKNGVVVCPIRPESFLHSLYYTQGNKEKMVQKMDMQIGLERALEELALHPEDKWSFTSKRIYEAMKSLGVSPQFDISNSEAYFQAVLSRVPDYL